MEIKRVKIRGMNKNRGIMIFIIFMILLFILKPIYGEAAYGVSAGNILGMEEKLKLMKRDFLYLNEEIERLYEECK